jgi:hypothetical protein
MKDYQNLIGKALLSIALIITALILAGSIRYAADRIEEGLMQQNVIMYNQGD